MNSLFTLNELKASFMARLKGQTISETEEILILSQAVLDHLMQASLQETVDNNGNMGDP